MLRISEVCLLFFRNNKICRTLKWNQLEIGTIKLFKANYFTTSFVLNCPFIIRPWFEEYLIWAAKDPYNFLFYVLLFLSPFFLVSAILSYKLSKAIEEVEKKVSLRIEVFVFKI